MINKIKTKLLLCIGLGAISFISQAATVYVVGSRSEMATITTAFEDAGDTVVRVNQSWNSISSDLLDDIFSADIIWEGDIFAGMNDDIKNRMRGFVNADKGLMLTAERECCETKNADIQEVARDLTGDVDLLIGGLGFDLFGHNFSNSPTTILTTPNDIRGQEVQMNGPGQVMPTGGVTSNACFVSSGDDRDFCTAAAWGADELVNNVGRMIVYGDVNSQPGLVNEFSGQQFENMREFLLSGLSGGGDVCLTNPNLPGCDENGGGGANEVNAPASLALLSAFLLIVSGYARKRA